eukprot:638855-Pleurochrysis_carterae.AAC.1
MISRANAAARAANKENMAAVLELEAQVQRLNEGSIWARVREEEVKRMQEQVDNYPFRYVQIRLSGYS